MVESQRKKEFGRKYLTQNEEKLHEKLSENEIGERKLGREGRWLRAPPASFLFRVLDSQGGMGMTAEGRREGGKLICFGVVKIASDL